MCDNRAMAEDPVVRASRRYRQAEHASTARRIELIVELGKATAAGRKQKDLIAATGFTREHVRRLIRTYQREMAKPDPFGDPALFADEPGHDPSPPA